MQFDNQKTRNVADVVAKILAGESAKQEPKMLEEELKGQQHKIDANKNNKIDAHDFKLLRAKKEVKKEEVEQIDEVFEKDDPVGTKKKTTMGTATKTATGMKHERTPEKDLEAGVTDWDKEERLSKRHLSPKPAKKKYGARQNYIRSTRVNESFTGLLSQYQEGGLKNLFESLKKEEEVLNEEVKEETVEVEVTDLNATNGVAIETIEERTLTEPETAKKEEIVKSMKKKMSGFKQRYGEDAKSVMYATATKMAKKGA